MAGAFVEADVATHTSIAVEVNYIQKGADFTQEGRDELGNFVAENPELTLSYLAVPVLVRIQAMGGTITPFVEAGPTLGFALGATTRTPSTPDADLGARLKPLDIGVAVGVGVRFLTQVGRLDVAIRYSRGFSDLSDIPNNAASINQGFDFTPALSR